MVRRICRRGYYSRLLSEVILFSGHFKLYVVTPAISKIHGYSISLRGRATSWLTTSQDTAILGFFVEVSNFGALLIIQSILLL